MKTEIINGNILEVDGYVCIVGHISDDEELGGAILAMDKALDGEISGAIESGEFSGKKGDILHVRTRGRVGFAHVLVVGEGKSGDLSVEVVRQVVGAAIKFAKSLKVKSVSCVLIGSGKGGLDVSAVSLAIGETFKMSLYSFDHLKSKDDEDNSADLVEAAVVELDGARFEIAVSGFNRGAIGGDAQNYARDLVNLPASSLLPLDIRNRALAIAENSDTISVRIMTEEEALEDGMNAFVAVGRGSKADSFFVHLTYTPSKKAEKKVALVGKGVTFDSGGLSLKPANYMETMKCDMAGAASVLGVFSALDELAPDIVVEGIIAACENMPGADAYRPGDVIVARNGVSIEVLNTDAEGRVTMADSLSYASDLKPDAIIDLATLTGACVVALGEEITGIMSDNEDLVEKVSSAASVAGEEIWRLPLFSSYEKLIESKVADVKNIGNRWGGTITAGLFLKKFVDPEIPWMHIDIAGPAFAERDYLSYIPQGGTGVAVRTLLGFIENY